MVPSVPRISNTSSNSPEGIDTVANVSLGSTLLGRTDNQHRKWVFDATEALAKGPCAQSGACELTVAIESAVDVSNRAFRAYPYRFTENAQYFPVKAQPAPLSLPLSL